MDKEKIVAILSEVKDPEIPVLSIAELGILRRVVCSGNLIQVEITPTYSGCPAMDTIEADIRSELASQGFFQVEIKQTLTPAWTTAWMTDAGREKLLAYGIAPPAGSCDHPGDDQPKSCPRCNSNQVEMISRFGSTACKALYRCLNCGEPFDYFKCH